MLIGDYEVVKELGRGGMGVVYAVRSPAIPGLRALKLLLQAADADARTRFRREAELLARVRHPGIVRIHEIGEDDGGLFLVMDLVEGEPIDEVLRRGPVAPDEARRWILEVADAVAAMHAGQVLHRDLKPANLMLCPDGRVLLLDFGLARTAGRSALTQTGSISGSPGYMAPEQADGRNEMTPAVDVHGLGAVLFAFLSGEAPFRGRTVLEGLKRVLGEEPEWPAHLPADLVAVGRRALAKDPLDRYRDAAAFAQALRSALTEPAKPRVGLWVGAAALVGAALTLSLALAASSLSPPSVAVYSPSAPPRETPPASPDPSIDLTRPPRDRLARAQWYREAWRLTRGAPLESATRRAFRKLQEEPLLSLSISRQEQARARFWGASHWVRNRLESVDYGAWASAGPSGLLPNGPCFTFFGGKSLWAFKVNGWRVWRSTQPGAALELVDFARTSEEKEQTTLWAIAARGDRLGLAGPRRIWESDLSASDPRLGLVYSGSNRNEVVGLAYTPGGQLVARSKRGNGTRIYLAAAPTKGVTLDRRAESMAAHPTEEFVVTGDNGGLLRVWRPNQPDMLALFERGGLGPSTSSGVAIVSLAFSPTGDRLYSGVTPHESLATDHELWVWRRRGPESWRKTRTQRLPWKPSFLDVSPDGAWLLISGEAGQVALWPAGDLQR